MPKPIPNTRTEHDAVERVELWYDSLDQCWNFQYTVENTHGKFMGRRVGSLDLQDPKANPVILRRALIARAQDKDTGFRCFVPHTDQWQRPGRGPDAGWCFKQRTQLDGTGF